MTNDNRYQKHLTLQDRYDIEDGLNHGYTMKKIADKLGKDRSTIAKEIRKHRIGDEGYNTHSNDCMYRYYCQKQSMCPECDRAKRCCTCKKNDCRTFCQDYRSDMCRNITRAPHVCNGCQSIYDCRKPHFYYRANVAYDTYKSLLKDTREKAKLEKNHGYIRKVIPKGMPLTGLTQEDMTLLANHINCTARASLNGRNPLELAQLLLDMKLIYVAGLKLIPADEIMLKQSLLKH